MTVATSMVEIVCCNAQCGVRFGMDERIYAERKSDRMSFFCTSGHRLHFVGETEEERLRRLLADERQTTNYYRESLDQESRAHRMTKRNLTRARNERDRIKTLIANGICPFGCKARSGGRHFTNVRRHMSTKHPEEARRR